jgi:hypothetical protein
MRNVLIKRMPDSETGDVVSSGIRDLCGEGEQRRAVKRGDETRALLAVSVSTIAIRKTW